MRDMVIETNRLLIKPLHRDHLDEIQTAKEEVWNDLQMWMKWARDDMKPRSALDTYMGMLDVNNPWDAAVAFARDDGRFAVMGGLHTGKHGDGDFSTGYWAANAQRGKGYATEMTNALIRHAFENLAARQVRICYYEGNAASRQIIDKLGFTYTHTDIGGHNRCSDGKPLDVLHFVMTDPAVLPPLKWRLIEV